MIRAIITAAAAAVMLTACGETDISTDKDTASASTPTTTTVKAEKERALFIMGESRDGDVILDDTSVASAEFVSYKNEVGDGPFYGVLITLDDKGREKFAGVTRNNIGKKISLWIGEECVFSPTVANEITDGKVMINELSYEKAYETANILNRGGN